MPRAAILDSSPIRGPAAIPPPTAHAHKRGTKRSADEAILLTPPRTVKREHKRRTGKRTVTAASTTKTRPRTRSNVKGKQTGSQSRHGQKDALEAIAESCEDEDEEPSLGDGLGRKLDFGRETKRRRTDSLDARLESLLEDPENPLWDSGLDKDKKANSGSDLEDKAEKTVRIRSPTPPVVHFKGKEPVSPPPSKKRTVKKGKRTVETSTVEEETETETLVLPLQAPSTPKKDRKRAPTPVRDSPNNPFLDDDNSPFSVSGEPAEPRTPTAHAEKPTISYVFRGVRAEFANPMYNLPSEVHERSLLPVTHPDYSPDPVCPPKLLFPKTRKRAASPSPTRAGRSKGGRMPQPSSAKPKSQSLVGGDNDWSDSDDDEQLRVTPPRRLFH